MRSQLTLYVLSLTLAVASAACSKDNAADPAAKSEQGGDAVAATVAEWKKAGLELSAFDVVDKTPVEGGKCRTGSVSGLEATLCEFSDEAGAKKAEPAGLQRVGDSTGAALTHGNVLLVLADRRGSDPNGRRINEVMKTFQRKAK